MVYEFLTNNELMKFAETNLICNGVLCQKANGYLYLKINDDFIFGLSQFVHESDKQIPNYFSEPKNSGAHISVVYPEELLRKVEHDSLGKILEFNLSRYFRAKVQDKVHFGCTIESLQLEKIRAELGLSSLLNFRGILVPFHFIIAVTKGSQAMSENTSLKN